jgi:ElaB/YqjD/DUF883 family membrane-anchored ribosome-binding protein
MDDAPGSVERSERSAGRTATAPQPGQSDPTLPAEADTRAREIREEIAQTRDDLTETIDAIQDRLKPSTIVANATETVRNRTTEKVKQMANTAGDAADRVLHNTIMDTVRENPWPVAMIGIGAAWLWLKSRDDSEWSSRSRYRSDYGPRDDEGRSYDWRTRTAASVEHPLAEYSEAADLEDPYDRREGYPSARRIGTAARRRTRRAQTNFNRVVRDNPLALGAAAAIVGVAVGATIPATDTENEWIGEARDTVVERAREMATDAADRVQSAANQVKDVAARAADATKPERQGSSPKPPKA